MICLEFLLSNSVPTSAVSMESICLNSRRIISVQQSVFTHCTSLHALWTAIWVCRNIALQQPLYFASLPLWIQLFHWLIHTCAYIVFESILNSLYYRENHNHIQSYLHYKKQFIICFIDWYNIWINQCLFYISEFCRRCSDRLSSLEWFNGNITSRISFIDTCLLLTYLLNYVMRFYCMLVDSRIFGCQRNLSSSVFIIIYPMILLVPKYLSVSHYGLSCYSLTRFTLLPSFFDFFRFIF